MEALFFICLYLVSAKLYRVKIDATIELLELALEGFVLVSDFTTTRWVTFSTNVNAEEPRTFRGTVLITLPQSNSFCSYFSSFLCFSFYFWK
jgi:hypothetical protein